MILIHQLYAAFDSFGKRDCLKMKKKKDILMLCQFFYPEYVSSATLPYDTAKYFVGQGYSVGALCGYPKEYNKDGTVPTSEEVDGIHVKRLRYLQMKRTGSLGRLVNFVSFFLAVLLHINILENYKAVIVYSNPPVLPLIGVLAKQLFHCKLVFVSYDVYPEIAQVSKVTSESSILSKVLEWVSRKTFKTTDRVVVLSEDMGSYLLEHRQIKEAKIVCIPNWYADIGETHKKKRMTTRLFQKYTESDFIVSHLGNMGTCQDETTIMDLLEKTKENHHIKYIFAGHGNKLEKIRQCIDEKQYRDRVQIYGFLHGEDFNDILAISDCFIVSLIDGLYGLCAPSKTASYLMQGRPVICIMDKETEIAHDISDNEAGVVAAVGESTKIVEYMEALMQSEDMQAEVSRNARNVYLKKYEKDVCLSKYGTLVKELLEA